MPLYVVNIVNCYLQNILMKIDENIILYLRINIETEVINPKVF